MCEILVKLQDSTSPHPNSSKRGDVVDVRPDGSAVGRLERPPLFCIVSCPQSVESRRHLSNAWEKPNPDVPDNVPGDSWFADGVDSHKHGWRFDFALLSVADLATLESTGRIHLDDAPRYMLEKSTGRRDV